MSKKCLVVLLINLKFCHEMQKKDTFHYTNKSKLLLMEDDILLMAVIYNVLRIYHTAARKSSKGIFPFNL